MARSSSIGGIFAELTLRDKKFATGMKGAGAKLKAFSVAAIKYGAMAGAALAAGLSVGVKRTIDMGGELTDLSAQTGVAIDSLMRIQQAYKDNGKEASAAGKDINKMQKAINAVASGEATSDPFAKIGLSAKNLMEMEPDRQFFEIAKAIDSIENPTQRAAIAMEIFGKSGGSLLAVFAGSDFESINNSLGQMPEIMRQFAGELDLAGDLLGRLPNKSDQFFAGFSAGIVRHILPSLQSIDDHDFTPTGQSIGNAIGSGIADSLMVWSTLINTIIDGVTSTTDDNFSFDDSWNKYSNAAIDLRSEQQEKIDKAIAEQAEKSKSLIEEITAPESGSAMSVDEADKILGYYEKLYGKPGTAITADATREMAEPSQPRSFNAPEFSDYQRRGLSLSESPSANLEKKTLDVMMTVRDILARIERSPNAATF